MRYVFDTSVLIDYLHDDDMAADSLFFAAAEGKVYISLISMMELYPPTGQRSNQQIASERRAIEQLCNRLGIHIVPCSARAQQLALSILEKHRTQLGRNALTDSLIIATDVTRRAYLVTTESKHHWFSVGQSLGLNVLSPVELLQET